MPYIHNKGNPASDVWVITNYPVSTDVERKYIFSGGTGFMFDKMLREVGIDDYFVTCYAPDTDNPTAYRNIDGELGHYQPKIILPIDACGAKLVPALVPKRQGKNYNAETDSEISKYCGSILTSPYLRYPHYIIPVLSPSTIVQQYKLRDQVLLDLAKAKHELDYAKEHGDLQPLPTRSFQYNFESIDEILYLVDSFCSSPYISVDIETIYPRADSKYYGQTAGLPIVLGLAPSKDFGISIDMFREDKSETRRLWKSLDNLFRNTKTIGQNFFNFDLYYLEMLGFEVEYKNIEDTLIQHHILWPELPHSLQYLTRQYTREPYYKDEGQGWDMKNMDGLKRYNCLDVTVTYEVWEAMQEEFRERPHLR